MRSDLRKEMLRILEESAKAETDDRLVLAIGAPALTREAVQLLKDSGAFLRCAKDDSTITIRGYDYYQQLKAPRAFWLKQNWFPVAVLLVSSLATVIASLIVVLLG